MLATTLWAGMWLVTGTGWWGLAATMSVGLVALAFGRWRRRWLIAVCGVALLGSVVSGGLRVWSDLSGPVRNMAEQGAIVGVEARLVGGGELLPQRFGGSRWQALARLERLDGRGGAWRTGVLVRISASGDAARAWADVAPGSQVRAAVRLSVPDEIGSVAAFARAREPPIVVAPPGPVDAAVTQVHHGLRDAVAGLSPDPRALVPALVVGDTSGMTDELVERFRTTGLTHLTAVSGANLTLLLASLLWAAGLLGLRGWWLRLAAAVGVVAFVLLCRGEPSVLRAAAMGTVGLLALGWGGRHQGMRYLSWAVVGLLLIDPWLSRSVGFALSTFASAGIILWAGPWSRTLSAWLPGWLAEAMAVPVAAQLATQPIVTAVSGQLSVVGLFANLVAAPLVGPGTVFGFLAAALSLVAPPAAAVAGWMAGWCAQGLCWVARLGDALPGASVRWPVGPLALVALTIACLTLPLLLGRVLRRPWLVTALALGLVVITVRPMPQPGWPQPDWQFVSCDVGQGDASVIQVAPGQAIVVDTGPEPRAVDRCLDDLGVTRVPLLVLSHLHADHIGGVAGVAAGREVGRLLVSDVREPAQGWQAVTSALSGVAPLAAVPGLTIGVGSAVVEVLAVRPLTRTPGEGEGESSDENDSSVVIRVRVGDLSVLVAGDVEEAGQASALASTADLHADVLLVPHHGSSRQSQAFLAASGASVALVSVGAGNDYGHPAARTVQLVADTGAEVYRTDQNGCIAVRRAGTRLVVTVQRQP